MTPAVRRRRTSSRRRDLKKSRASSRSAPRRSPHALRGPQGPEAESTAWTTSKFKPLTIGLQYKALETGKIDVAPTSSRRTASSPADKYVVLEDPKGIFGFQNVAPVVEQKVLDGRRAPEFAGRHRAGQLEAHERGDAGDERPRRHRQAEAGRRRRAVPEANGLPRLAVSRASSRPVEPKPPSPRARRGERVDLDDLRRGDRDDDELGDAVARRDVEGARRGRC